MNDLSTRLHYTLRAACAMCFIGHGAFGIITKKIWCNYFAVFGIGQETAYHLMPVVGAADILFGLILIIYPLRIVAGWLVFWGVFTALLRPLSHEPVAEFIERAGNYGAPLVLLFLSNTQVSRVRTWFTRMNPANEIDNNKLEAVAKCLTVFGFMILAGHGWLNLIEKPGLLAQYSGMGFNNPAQVARIVGVFEIASALAILIKPFRSVILILLVWKMGSELLYPSYPFFEWVERGGSYGVLLALWFVLDYKYKLTKPAGMDSNAVTPQLN